MTAEATIETAIARSVSHTEIVKVEVEDIAAALAEVNAASEDYDHTDDERGGVAGEDVWGTTDQGSEFRLFLVRA